MKGRKSENSGFGIVVMDEKGQTLYEGGGIVRSDGNNFIPEIAAAAIHYMPFPIIYKRTFSSTTKRRFRRSKKNHFRRGVESGHQVGRGKVLFGVE